MEALWESAAGSPLASVSPGSKPSLAFSWGCSRLTPAIYRATYFLHTCCLSTYLPTIPIYLLFQILTYPIYLSFPLRTGPRSHLLSQISILNFTFADLHSHLRQQMVLCHGRF